MIESNTNKKIDFILDKAKEKNISIQNMEDKKALKGELKNFIHSTEFLALLSENLKKNNRINN